MATSDGYFSACKMHPKQGEYINARSLIQIQIKVKKKNKRKQTVLKSYLTLKSGSHFPKKSNLFA